MVEVPSHLKQLAKFATNLAQRQVSQSPRKTQLKQPVGSYHYKVSCNLNRARRKQPSTPRL